MCPASYLMGIWVFLRGYSGLNVKLTLRHVVHLVQISLWEKLKRNTVEPVYNDIGLYDTSPIASNTLWHQIIHHYNHNIIKLGYDDARL